MLGKIRLDRDVRNFNDSHYDIMANLIDDINQSVDLINNAQDLFLFSEKEREIVKKRQDWLRSLQERLTTGNGITEHLDSDNKNHYQDLAIKINKYTWEKIYKEKLDDDDIFLTSSSRGNYLRRLCGEWKKITYTARWNNEQLCYVANKLYPHLLALVEKSFMVLKNARNKFQREIYQFYYQSLTNLSKELFILGDQIANSMFFRLKMLNRIGYTTSVIHEFTNNMAKSGINIRNNEPDVLTRSVSTPDPLTSVQFIAFHRFIAQYGKRDIISSAKRQLRWLKEPNIVVLDNQGKKVKFAIIPSEFRKYVPDKPSIFSRLFRGHNFRHQFFGDRSFFIAMMSQSDNDRGLKPKELVNINDFNKAYDLLCKSQKHIEDELCRIPILLSGFNIFLHQKTRKFIRRWELSVTNHYRKNILSKIDLANDLVFKINSSMDSSFLKWNEVILLTRIIDDLQKDISSSKLGDDISNRFDELKRRSLKIIIANKAISIIKKSNRLGFISEDEFKFLDRYVDGLKSDDKQDAQLNSYRTICRIQLFETIEAMKGCLKSSLQSDHFCIDRNFNHLNFSSCYRLIQMNSSASDVREVNKSLLKYFLHFISCASNGQPLVGKVKDIESFFISVGNEIYFNGVSISDYIKELKSAREKYGYSVVYPVKCRALAIQLNDFYFKHFFEKDFDSLESRIESEFLDIKHRGHLNTFLRVRRMMIEENTDLLRLSDKLAPFEKTILGLDKGNKSTISRMLNVSVQAYRARNLLNRKDADYSSKMKSVNALSRSLSDLFHCGSIKSESFTLSKSRRRLLFEPPRYISMLNSRSAR